MNSILQNIIFVDEIREYNIVIVVNTPTLIGISNIGFPLNNKPI